MGNKSKIAYFLSSVPAGFPSPANDFIENKLDLNEHLVDHPAATFFVRVKGESMINDGIFDGDLLIVDRSLEATNNSVIIALLDGEFTLKRIKKEGSTLWLKPSNPKFKPTRITEEMAFEVWGVVKHVIKTF